MASRYTSRPLAADAWSISKKRSARLIRPSLSALYSLKLSFSARYSAACARDQG